MESSEQVELKKNLFHLAEKENGGYGYKTANLMMMQKATATYNERHPDNQYTLNIPKFIGIPSDFMIDLINQLTKADLKELYKLDPKNFSKNLGDILSQINSEVAINFMNKKMENNLLAFLNECMYQNNKIMVRSTGREDTEKMANAGGNETIANVSPSHEAVWSAIKEVLLSYFSDQSLTQQKLGKTIESADQDHSTVYLPVLLQVMVGETKTSGVPTSGVLFSEDPETHVFGSKAVSGIALLDFTYGHCEAVVNSLLPTDQLRIDDSGLMYPHFTQKYYRLAPDPDKSGKLISVANDKAIIDRPSLDKSAALILKRFGNYLEKHFYGYAVDIEFTVLGKQIHIVQNRPITYDERVFQPSYIDAEQYGAITPDKGTIGKVIGTGHKEVREVHKNNIITTKNLPDALKIYLDMVAKKTEKDIAFILVEEMAAPTSHAATVFRGVSLPVICVKDIRTINNLPEIHKILISPQQGVLLWNPELNILKTFVKPGFASFPMNELSADAHWLKLPKISDNTLSKVLTNGKATAYHTNPELAALQANLLACIKYYSVGLVNLEKDSPTFLLRQKALELLKTQAAILQHKIIQPENKLNNAYPVMKDERSIQYMKLAEYAQDDAVEQTWVQFIKDLDNLDVETQNKFSLMFAKLARYKILPIWLNSFFYNKASDTSNNKYPKLICLKLLNEFNDNISHMEGVTELLQEVQNWDRESFADPKTFNQKLSLFQKLLQKFSHAKLYEVFKDVPPIYSTDIKTLFTNPLNNLQKAALKIVKAQKVLDIFKEKCIPEIQKKLPMLEEIRAGTEYQEKLSILQEQVKQENVSRLENIQNEYNSDLKNIQDEYEIKYKRKQDECDECNKELVALQTLPAQNEEDQKYVDYLEKNIKKLERGFNSLKLKYDEDKNKLAEEYKPLFVPKTTEDIKKEAIQSLDEEYSINSQKKMLEIAKQAGFIKNDESTRIDPDAFVITNSELVSELNHLSIADRWDRYKKTKDEVDAFISKYRKNSRLLIDCQYQYFYDVTEHFNYVKTRDQRINQYSKNDENFKNVFNDLNIQLNKNYIEKLVDNKSPNVNQIYQEIFESNNYEEKLSSLFGDKQPYLAQVVWLKCLDELVDCVDLSIKSLTGSTLYIKDDQSDAVSSQKTQFDHFKTLLHESYTLLKTILCLKNPDQTKDAFEKNKISPCTHQLISRLNEGFDNFDNLYSGKNFSLSKIMNPSPNFNVAEQIIGNVTAYVGLRRINAIETGDDLFTTIHQNELSTLSTLNKIILGKNEIKLNPYATLFMNLIKNEGGTRYFSKPDLRNMEIKGKKIILNYTVALNNHSSTIRFACDKDGSHAEMTIDFFGSNNGRDRWEVIKSEIEKDFSSSIKTIVQNNQGVSATLAIPKVDLTESGLRKYFRAFEFYVLISNGWNR